MGWYWDASTLMEAPLGFQGCETGSGGVIVTDPERVKGSYGVSQKRSSGFDFTEII